MRLLNWLGFVIMTKAQFKMYLDEAYWEGHDDGWIGGKDEGYEEGFQNGQETQSQENQFDEGTAI